MDKYSEIQEQLEKFKNDGNNIDYFFSYANLNLRSNPEYVKELMGKVLEIAEEKNYQIPRAYCLNSIGWYYHDMCDYDRAIEYHTEANRIFSENSHEFGTILTCNALLGDYMQMGLFDLAIEWGLRGINLSDKTAGKQYLVPLLINTGTCYVKLRYYKEARDVFSQLNAVKYQLSKENTIILNQSMAELEFYSGNIDAAYMYASRGYEIAKDSGLTSIIAEILGTRAMINAAYGKEQEAEEDFTKASEMSKEVKEMNIYCSILTAWGKYHADLCKFESSEEKLLEAVKISQEIKSKTLLINAYTELGQLYKKTKSYEKAIECIEIYEKYEKEIFNRQSSVWIARMQDDQIKREATVYKSLYDQIASISTIGQKITSDLNLENILDTIYYEVNHLLKADIFGIATYNESEKNLDYAMFIEQGKRLNMGFVSIDDESSFGAYCVKNKTDIMLNDIYNEYQMYVPSVLRNVSNNTRSNSLIYCPLKVGNKVTGLINVQSYNKNAYDVNDLNTLRILASYIAIALENASLFKEIEYSAAHDYLTGLLNRREIFKEGVEAFNRFSRYNENISTIMVDIDNFKRVNDTYGHCAGDEVLKKVAEVIKSSIRKTDFAGRYGGEEFILVLSHSDARMAVELAERIRRALENSTVIYNGDEIKVTVSVGVFQYSKDTKSFDEGIDFADEALYKAKHTGRNKVVPFAL